jgi:hypothetical protein
MNESLLGSASDFGAEFEGREEEVLEGRSQISETGGQELKDLGHRAEWGIMLQSLEVFPCARFGVAVEGGRKDERLMLLRDLIRCCRTEGSSTGVIIQSFAYDEIDPCLCFALHKARQEFNSMVRLVRCT